MKPWELFKLIQDTDYIKVGDDVDYKVITYEGRPCLLFQQSSTKEDWKNNFDFPRKLYKDQGKWLRVHRGFGNAWKSANDTIMEDFIKACQTNENMPLIAGWSFGGAMALLAAEDFNYRTNKRVDVITFGAPKVAGDLWTQQTIYECGDFTQFVNVNDVVPLCPPLPWFHHINKKKVGQPGCIINLFKPDIYHCSYGDPAIYGGN